MQAAGAEGPQCWCSHPSSLPAQTVVRPPAWLPADEPVQPYDEMDEKAKDLLDAIHERQAYINAGGRQRAY